MRGNEEVMVANGRASTLQRRTDVRVVLVGGFVERKYRQGRKQLLNALRGGAAKLNTAESGKAAPMGEDRARYDRSREDEQTTAPQPLSGIQGQGGD